MDLEMRTWYGAPGLFRPRAVHAIVYWVTVSFLTPFILLVAFNHRRRLLHDMLVGTIVINNPPAQALRRAAALRARALRNERRGKRFDGCGARRSCQRRQPRRVRDP